MNLTSKPLAAGFFLFFLFFPAFSARAASVPEITSADYIKRIGSARGKVVVVNIFASWCEPCREELPDLIAIREAFSEEELFILGISVDQPTERPTAQGGRVSEALNVFLKTVALNYPVYIADEQFIQDLRITAVPQFFIHNKEGRRVESHKGLMPKAQLEQLIVQLLTK